VRKSPIHKHKAIGTQTDTISYRLKNILVWQCLLNQVSNGSPESVSGSYDELMKSFLRLGNPKSTFHVVILLAVASPVMGAVHRDSLRPIPPGIMSQRHKNNTKMCALMGWHNHRYLKLPKTYCGC